MSEIKKFNRNYLQHSQNRGKLLTELSYFVKWKPDQFVISNEATNTLVENLDTITFFRNLNEQLLVSEPYHDFFGIAFQVIDISIKNAKTRRFLIDSVRIITGVSKFALKLPPEVPEEKQIQIWTLMENITNGINITSEEPYLTDLIEHLVTSIKDSQLSSEIKILQTSVLTNLCFNNQIAVACLCRFTKAKELLAAVQDIHILWCKMAFTIARFDHEMLDFELITIFKSVFALEYFSGLIRTKNQRLLKHILELLEKCLQRDEYSKNTLEQFDFNETIDGVLQIFDYKMEEESENSEHINLFLGIVNLILSTSNESLLSNAHRLFKLAIKEVGTVTISSAAIKTVRLTISNFEIEQSPELITFISRLLENIDHCNVQVASEVYQLLSTMYTKYHNMNDDLSADLIETLTDVKNWCFKLTDDNLSIQLYRIEWLLIYTSQNEKHIPKLENVLQNKNVHNILANGLRSPSEDMCALTMTLIRSDHFPLQAVSKILANENLLTPTQSQYSCNCNRKSSIQIERPCFSAALENRVNVAVDQVMAKLKDDSQAGRTEIINILEYQNILNSSKIKLLESQRKMSSELISAQENEIGSLNIIIRRCNSKISEMELKELHNQTKEKKLKTGYSSVKLKYDNVSLKFDNLSKTYDGLKQERTRLKTAMKDLEQEKYNLQNKLDKETKAYETKLDQQNQQHQREISEQKNQHQKELDNVSSKLTQQTEKQKEDLKHQHMQDLAVYSKKHAQLLKKSKEDEQQIEAYKRELENFSTKVDELKTELAASVSNIAKYKNEINEKEVQLAATTKKLNDSEQRLEMITSFCNKK